MDKLIEALTAIHKGEGITPFGSELNRIGNNPFGGLYRIWNEGRGRISFAEKDTDGTVLINDLFCSKAEIKRIKNNLKVPFEFISLGYPDYYTKGLRTIRAEKKP